MNAYRDAVRGGGWWTGCGLRRVASLETLGATAPEMVVKHLDSSGARCGDVASGT